MKLLSWIPGTLKLLGALAPFIRGLIESFETPGMGPEKKQMVLDAVKESLEKLEVPGVIETFVMWFADWLVDKIVDVLNKSGHFNHEEG